MVEVEGGEEQYIFETPLSNFTYSNYEGDEGQGHGSGQGGGPLSFLSTYYAPGFGEGGAGSGFSAQEGVTSTHEDNYNALTLPGGLLEIEGGGGGKVNLNESFSSSTSSSFKSAVSSSDRNKRRGKRSPPPSSAEDSALSGGQGHIVSVRPGGGGKLSLIEEDPGHGGGPVYQSVTFGSTTETGDPIIDEIGIGEEEGSTDGTGRILVARSRTDSGRGGGKVNLNGSGGSGSPQLRIRRKARAVTPVSDDSGSPQPKNHKARAITPDADDSGSPQSRNRMALPLLTPLAIEVLNIPPGSPERRTDQIENYQTIQTESNSVFQRLTPKSKSRDANANPSEPSGPSPKIQRRHEPALENDKNNSKGSPTSSNRSTARAVSPVSDGSISDVPEEVSPPPPDSPERRRNDDRIQNKSGLRFKRVTLGPKQKPKSKSRDANPTEPSTSSKAQRRQETEAKSSSRDSSTTNRNRNTRPVSPVSDGSISDDFADDLISRPDESEEEIGNDESHGKKSKGRGGAGDSSGPQGGPKTKKTYRRHVYSLDDDKAILKFIVKKRYEHYVLGNGMWEYLEEKGILPGVPWQGMRQHFRNAIQPKLHDPKFGLEPKILLRLQKGIRYAKQNPRSCMFRK